MAFRFRSLRFKLAAWFVLVFGLIQTCLVVGIVVLRREFIRRALDEDLEESAAAMVNNVLAANKEWTTEQMRALEPKDARFQLFIIRDREGTTFCSWNVPDPDRLPFSVLEVVPAGPVGSVMTSLGGDRAEALVGEPDRLRVITLPFRFQEKLYFFQAAVRDEAFERLLVPFLDLVMLGVPVGLIAASIAAWTIAGRAVRPIDRLASAARAVDAASLDASFAAPTSDEEVARLSEALNGALARLKERYDAQEQFIGNVAHQLKTPIAVVLAEAQVARLGADQNERAWEFVETTEARMQRLGRLVESFLILAREDLGEDLSMEPVLINDVLLQTVQHATSAAEAKDVRLVANLLEGDEAARVRGDEGLLGTMLENLLGNAIRFSPKGAEVMLQASIGREGLRIDVRDQGPGIPEGDLERIFERFVRLPGTNGGSDGTGIGLAIARTIARLHQGSVQAQNRETGGASFTVTLPLLREPEAEPVFEV